VIAGIAVAAAFALSPLTTIAIPLAVASGMLAIRGLPAGERRTLIVLLGIAFAARLAVIVALMIAGIPGHSDAGVGGLSGDDAYYFGRAIRARDLLLGFASGKYDYFVVSDSYGQTSYLKLLTWIQVALGPTPYGMRVLNAVMYLSGCALLFRAVRRGFGSLPAYVGLGVLLFLPSLFFSSISLLKESLFFLLTALVLWSLTVVRSNRQWRAAGVIAVAALCVWLLGDLRRGGLILAVAGIALAVIARVVFAGRGRVALAGVAVAAMLGMVASSPSLQARFISAVTSAATVQSGHVFTVGHAYKLLDEGFYMTPRSPEGLTFPQSARFVVRGAASFALTPLPWQIQSRGELAFLPEHLLWYVMLVLAPIGCVAGWKRDPWLTCLLAGYVLPTAVALALTNGNVGTLLRLRGLVTPQLVWIAAIGLVAVWETILLPSRRRGGELAIEGQRP
jgi:hypothetical protein